MASRHAILKTQLSAKGLLGLIEKPFSAIRDLRREGSVKHSLRDTLFAALAMFQLKHPSLLDFDRKVRGESDSVLLGNLKRLYRLNSVASDTELRQILDAVSPESLRPAFRACHSAIQRSGVLEDFKVLDGQIPISVDGTGLFSSTSVSCPQCGVKKHRKRKAEYYHQLLVAAIATPNHKTALPIDFEPIVRSDGEKKNDCERNAARRLLPSIRAQYPKRRFIVLEDALSANGPHLQMLDELNMDYLISAKPDGCAHLFKAFDQRRDDEPTRIVEQEKTDESGFVRGYRYSHDLPLNASHPSIRVNVLEYWEVDTKGKERNWMWITNLAINEETVLELVSVARTRWRIENEVFNTLKNQGYNLEHNFGHGKQYLSSTLAGLMLLAFLIDQIQEHACGLYQAARKRNRIFKNLWSRMQIYLDTFELEDWDTFLRLLAGQGPPLPSVAQS